MVLLSQFTDTPIAGSNEQPGREWNSALNIEISYGFINVEEDLLADVFHYLFIAHEAINKIQKMPVVFLHKEGERLAIAGLNALYSFDIVSWESIRSVIDSRLKGEWPESERIQYRHQFKNYR